MSEMSDKQFKEIHDACLDSYRTGYREGYIDACDAIKPALTAIVAHVAEDLKRAAQEAFGEVE